jgi:16S rRNA (uracil1498-N3)-methyltransferase
MSNDDGILSKISHEATIGSFSQRTCAALLTLYALYFARTLIVPVITARSIPQREKEKDLKRLQRWRNIVRSASAQCRRAFLAQVEPVLEFGSALSRLEGFRTLVPWEEEKVAPLSEILKQPCPSDRVILFFIGPEGGFTSVEIEALRKAGAITVNLGPRIMRSETAAAAVAVMVQAAWGDLSGEGECS